MNLGMGMRVGRLQVNLRFRITLSNLDPGLRLYVDLGVRASPNRVFIVVVALRYHVAAPDGYRNALETQEQSTARTNPPQHVSVIACGGPNYTTFRNCHR